jgi:hypothetical protein
MRARTHTLANFWSRKDVCKLKRGDKARNLPLLLPILSQVAAAAFRLCVGCMRAVAAGCVWMCRAAAAASTLSPYIICLSSEPLAAVHRVVIHLAPPPRLPSLLSCSILISFFAIGIIIICITSRGARKVHKTGTVRILHREISILPQQLRGVIVPVHHQGALYLPCGLVCRSD